MKFVGLLVTQKGHRAKLLERKCLQLAALTQRRLATSASLNMGSGAGGGGVGGATTGMSMSGNMKEVAWSARETRKESLYKMARDMGKAESCPTSASALAVPELGSRKLLQVRILLSWVEGEP